MTQEAFVKAFAALGSFREGAVFRPWLLRIVANQAGNHRRGARRRERRERRDAMAGRDRQATLDEPGDVAQQSDERRRLVAAMSSLPHKDRQVLAIRYLLGYSEEETAGVLGCARGTVKSRTSRALEKLRAHTDVAGLGERT